MFILLTFIFILIKNFKFFKLFIKKMFSEFFYNNFKSYDFVAMSKIVLTHTKKHLCF